MMTTDVREGDRVEVHRLVDYKLVQERPFDCRFRCQCERGCNGKTEVYAGTVSRLIHWADNSVEAVVACDDGEERRMNLVPPHGDACF